MKEIPAAQVSEQLVQWDSPDCSSVKFAGMSRRKINGERLAKVQVFYQSGFKQERGMDKYVQLSTGKVGILDEPDY